MALLTDANIIGLDDLSLYETTVTNVTSTHGIDINTKIAISTASVGDRLLLRLLKAGLSDPQHTYRRQLGVSTVVVTPPLDRWLCLDVLAGIFSEAYNVQLNDRFKGKWAQYVALADVAEQLMWQYGVGITYKPLPKPLPALASVQTGPLSNQELLVQVAWTDADGNEGALSPALGLEVANGSGVAVSTAEGAVAAPASAAGWNAYLGRMGLSVTRQNNAPIPIGSTWFLPDSGMIQGPIPVDGQSPDYYVIDPRRIPRG
jgi:hypothetical protein